jgi:valyl-tRNA synthetase
MRSRVTLLLAKLDGLEEKWAAVWQEQDTYAFDREAALAGPREAVFSIDTPPPTASGSLHMGHVFSYTHTDCMARYKRMPGSTSSTRSAGTTTACPPRSACRTTTACAATPSLPYDPDFEPPFHGDARDQGRRQCPSAAELHRAVRRADRARRGGLRVPVPPLGLSLDWSMTYRTIDDHSRATSQQAFLRNLARGEAYQAEAPGLWDVTFQTAVAQAELEARDYPGHYHRVAFHRPTGPVHIETTRPELIPAAWRSSPTPTTSATSRCSARR